MTNMLGAKGLSPIVVIDSDALIAILHKEDALSDRANQTLSYLAAHDAKIIYPVTTITETLATLTRKLNQPSLAVKLVDQVKSSDILIESANDSLLASALNIFDPASSKQNTIFDAMVAATARKLNTPYVFAFDGLYTKLGFTLASDLTVAEEKGA